MMIDIIINEMVCGGLSLIMFIGMVLVGVAQHDNQDSVPVRRWDFLFTDTAISDEYWEVFC
jgi:hypothetical protein